MHQRIDGSGLGHWQRLGSTLILVVLGGFIVWAALVPLNSASVSPGQVIQASPGQQLTHVQGGWIKGIYVEQGQRVIRGQLLAELEDPRLVGERQRLQQRVWRLEAARARLKQELEGEHSLEMADTIPKEIAREQRAIHLSQQAEYKLQLEELQQNKVIKEQDLAALEMQKRRLEERRALGRQELQIAEELASQAYLAKMQLLAMRGRQAELEGQVEVNLARIHQAKAAILSLTNQIARLGRQKQAQRLSELADVAQSLSLSMLELEAIDQQLALGRLYANQDGVIAALKPDPVARRLLAPGEILLQVVGEGAPWVIEGLVDPKDRDDVRQGMTARVQLVGFNARRLNALYGRVTHVDLQLSDVGELKGYRYRVEIDVDSLNGELADRITPGMPAQVMIEQESRTLLQQLWFPLQASMDRALIEH